MKTILITGSTDGIGKGTALKLAKEGHRVFLHGRSEAKVNEVVSEIKRASNNQNIKGFVADFSDLEAVKKFSEEIKKEVPKIDILINNAGIYTTKETLTPKGLDYRMVVNYLAPYLLTTAILPIIRNSEAPRIINLSSAAQTPVSEETLKGMNQQSERETYAQSKLALTMWSFHLAQQEPDITVIAVNPGSLLNTKMVKETFGQHWSPAEKGVDILHSLAMDHIHSNRSGQYFDNDRGDYAKAHPEAYDEVKINDLLATTNSILDTI
tara:strand:+ start:207174 stop:207974 length:801 start_codon:yes stop_codon:yes gene_type:complete